jgi:hypothetical protein
MTIHSGFIFDNYEFVLTNYSTLPVLFNIYDWEFHLLAEKPANIRNRYLQQWLFNLKHCGSNLTSQKVF